MLNPSWTIDCSGPGTQLTPALGNSGLPALGSTYDVTLAVLASGFSDSTWSGGSLPSPLPNAPGCDLLVSPAVLDAVVTSAAGTSSSSLDVPNVSSLVGLELFHQWAVLDSVNPAGIVLSNAGRAGVGN